MKQDILEEWAAHLEFSGLEQNIGSLKTGESFCCLGVLCEMAVAAGVVTEKDGRYASVEDDRDWSSGSLPEAVEKWAGLSSHFPTSTSTGTDLHVLNDKELKTFPQIAKIIRRGVK